MECIGIKKKKEEKTRAEKEKESRKKERDKKEGKRKGSGGVERKKEVRDKLSLGPGLLLGKMVPRQKAEQPFLWILQKKKAREEKKKKERERNKVLGEQQLPPILQQMVL